MIDKSEFGDRWEMYTASFFNNQNLHRNPFHLYPAALLDPIVLSLKCLRI